MSTVISECINFRFGKIAGNEQVIQKSMKDLLKAAQAIIKGSGKQVEMSNLGDPNYVVELN
ncbi:unnamed protein product, partial [Allacma fusca]